MRNPFRRLLPRHETYLLLSRLPAPIDPAPTPDVDIAHLTAPDHPAVQALDQFCTTNGFPPGWPADMLAGGARAITASDPQTHTLIAMAWHTAAPFFVEEIDHTLDPAGGVYLFGDFVAPASRGRGLQRALVRQRLALAPNLTAHTITRDDNLPSLKSYQALGFTPTTRLTSHRWLGLTRWRCTPVAGADGRLPAFERHPGKRLIPRPYAASSST